MDLSDAPASSFRPGYPHLPSARRRRVWYHWTGTRTPDLIMPDDSYYSPRIDRFLVKALYYEAKRRGKPMTALANEFVSEGLKDSDGWKVAEAEVQNLPQAPDRSPAPQPKNDP